jgi:hypothetical protein
MIGFLPLALAPIPRNAGNISEQVCLQSIRCPQLILKHLETTQGQTESKATESTPASRGRLGQKSDRGALLLQTVVSGLLSTFGVLFLPFDKIQVAKMD